MSEIEKLEEDINGVSSLLEKQVIARDYLIEQKKKREELVLKMSLEIQKATEKIKKSYENDFLDIDINIKKTQFGFISNYNKLIEVYSLCDAELIGRAIERLIQLASGQIFKFQKADLHVFSYEHDPFGYRHKVSYPRTFFMVVDEKVMKDSYEWPYCEDNELELLLKGGNAILMGRMLPQEKISCYTIEDGEVKLAIEVGEFGYVESFVNFVVQYRFLNSLEVFGEEDMLKCLEDFIQKNKDEIREKRKFYFDKKLDEEINNLVLRRKKDE